MLENPTYAMVLLVYWAAIALSLSSCVAAIALYRKHGAVKAELRGARRALLRQESKAQAIAEQMAVERDAVLARICHDLRNPATVVSLCGEILEVQESCESRQAASSMLRSSAQSINYLTNLLLSYGRSLREIDASDTQGPANVQDVFEAIATATSERQTDDDVLVSFTPHIDPDAPQWLRADFDMLVQLLEALIDNALRHAEKGAVSLLYRVHSTESLSLEVHDTGSGMTSEVLQRVFHPFQKARDEGTHCRLGMSVVKNMVDRLGGNVEIQSSPGLGTKVIVVLPRELAATAPDEDQDSCPRLQKADGMDGTDRPVSGINLSRSVSRSNVAFSGRARSGKRIIVVDDELAVADAIASRLRSAGCDILACNEDVQMDLISRWKPDLLLTDLKMPKRDGFQLARQIRECMGPDTPTLIAISGSHDLLARAREDWLFDACYEKEHATEALLGENCSPF